MAEQSLLDRIYARINGGLDAMDASMVAVDARVPRKRWSFSIGDTAHVLEIRKPRWRWQGHRIALDGAIVGTATRTSGRRPHTELPISVGSSSIVVSIEWRADWEEFLRVDVFVDGTSLLDGSSLAEARKRAPARAAEYDALLPYAQRALLLGLLFWPSWLVSACARAAMNHSDMNVAFLVALWMGSWDAAIALVNRYNLHRPRLGAVRWLTVGGTAVLYPVITVIVLVGTGRPR